MYELIPWIYVSLTIASLYPLMFQSILFMVRKNTPRSDTMGSVGGAVIIVPAKSEPLDLIYSSMKELSKLKGVSVIYVLDDYKDEELSRIREAALSRGYGVVARRGGVGYKGGALNYALKFVNADRVVVLDVDSRIEYNDLEEALRLIEVGDAVVPRWVVSNPGDSPLSRGQWLGYEYFSVVLSGLFRLTGWVPIVGSGSVVKMSALKDVGYWPEDILEDIELGLKFLRSGKRIIYVPYIKAFVEAPVNYFSFIRQQCRWSLGAARVIRKHWLDVLTSKGGFVILLYLGQYSSHLFHLLSLILLGIMVILGLQPTLHGFLLILTSALLIFTIYTAEVLMNTGTLGLHRYRDLASISVVNMAYILGLPRISVSYILGLMNKTMKWVPTPKGPGKWVRSGNVVPELTLTTLIAALFIISIIRGLYLDSLIALPYLLLCIRGSWKLIKNQL